MQILAALPNIDSVWVRVVDKVPGAVFEQEITADLPPKLPAPVTPPVRAPLRVGVPRRQGQRVQDERVLPFDVDADIVYLPLRQPQDGRKRHNHAHASWAGHHAIKLQHDGVPAGPCIEITLADLICQAVIRTGPGGPA